MTLLKKITLNTASLILCAQVLNAQTVTELINLPHTNKPVEVTVNTANGEYVMPVESLVRGEYLVKENSTDCSKAKIFVDELKGTIPGSYYDKEAYQIDFRLLDGLDNNEAVKLQLFDQLSSKGIKLESLTDKTQFLIDKVEVEFEWDEKSLTTKAASNVSAYVSGKLEEELNKPETIQQIASTGHALVSFKPVTFYCDLLNKKVLFNIRFKGLQFSETKKPSSYSVNEILMISKGSKDLSVKLKVDQISNADTQKLYSSAILGAQLEKLGKFQSVAISRHYEKLFNSIYSDSRSEFKSMNFTEAKEVSDSFIEINVLEKPIQIEIVNLRKAKQ